MEANIPSSIGTWPDEVDRPPSGPASWRRLWIVWGILVVLGFIGRLYSGYDADEMQHLHFAWNIAQGQLPYRDFFEHHPPLLHFLLAPLVRSPDEPDVVVLVLCRLGALGVVIALLVGLYSLLRRSAGPTVACWGVGTLLTMHPFSTAAFEMRPDGIGLACLLAALMCLLTAIEDSRRQVWSGALTAGVLAGVGICFTQKTGVLLFAAGLWAFVCCLCARDSLARRRRAVVVATMMIASTLPILAVMAPFARQGALVPFFTYTVAINFRYASEGTWRYVAQESLLGSFVLYVLAYARILRIAGNLRSHLARATPDSLIAILLVIGTISQLKNPMPHSQSYLFLIVPWTAYLATCSLARYVEDATELGRDSRVLVAALVFCLAGLYWYNIIAVAVVWGPLLLFGVRYTLRASPRNDRIVRTFATALAVGILLYIGKVADAVWRNDRRAQARVLDFVHARIARHDSVLSAWPLVAPFHAQPSYHGFARNGLIHTETQAVIETEYIEAVRKGRVALIVVNPQETKRLLPRFQQFLDRECVSVPEIPADRNHLAAYTFAKPRAGL